MEHLEKRQKVIIMLAVMAAMFFAAVNMTIVGTSLPKIVAQIGGMEYFDWVFTIYMLASTVTAMLVGKLSDMYGRKIFILIGIGVFSTGAFLCGLSDTIFELILYRGIQGFGGGMIMSTAFMTIGDLFVPRERGRWQGLLGSVFGLSSLFGPTLGGYLVDHFDWHWIFWIFLPIGLIAFALIWRLYPSHERQGKERVDYLGSGLLTLMIVSLLLGFSWGGGQYAWISWPIMGLFGLSIVSLVTFIWVEKKAVNPVLPLHLFQNSIFTLSNIAGLFLGVGMFSVIMYTPFFVQGVLGESATTSGLVEMIMTLGMVGCSALAGQLITKTGRYKVFAVWGLTIMAIGLLLNSFLTIESSLTQLVLQLIVIGIGLGMCMPVFQVMVQNSAKHKYLGVATSAMQVFRQIGATIGVALMGTVMNSRMEQRMQESAPDSVPVTNTQALEALQNPQLLMDSAQLEAIRSSLPAEMTVYFDQLVGMLREALNYSLTGVFFLCACIMVVAVVVTLFIREIPLRTTNQDDAEEESTEMVNRGSLT